MLISSLLIGLAGMVLIAALMATEWYIWEPRYRGVQAFGPGPTHGLVTDGRDSLRASAGSDRVVPFASQPVRGQILANQVQGGWMDHCPLS